MLTSPIPQAYPLYVDGAGLVDGERFVVYSGLVIGWNVNHIGQMFPVVAPNADNELKTSLTLREYQVVGQ